MKIPKMKANELGVVAGKATRASFQTAIKVGGVGLKTATTPIGTKILTAFVPFSFATISSMLFLTKGNYSIFVDFTLGAIASYLVYKFVYPTPKAQIPQSGFELCPYGI